MVSESTVGSAVAEQDRPEVAECAGAYTLTINARNRTNVNLFIVYDSTVPFHQLANTEIRPARFDTNLFDLVQSLPWRLELHS